MQTRTIVRSVVLTALMATTAAAQEAVSPASSAPPAPPVQAPAETPTPKRMTVTMALDFTSAYLFRGIRQHSGGTIAQPAFDVGVALGRGISLNVGNWDSVHSTAPAGTWYESDYYGSLTFTAGKLKPVLLYTSYTSPADSFATVKELAGVVAFDDSGSAFPLLPKAVIAFELGEGQADAGARKGVYLELGVKPNIKLAPKLSLYIPVKTGLSLKDYYEGPFQNDGFGYFDTGFQLSVPAVSGRSGAVEVHGGLDFYWLGDNLKAINEGKGRRTVASIGLAFTY
jgi:Bacterial protein of unknown function (Gcw_chp)